MFREALRLRLRANKDGDPEDYAAKTEEKGALAMAKKAKRNIELRTHYFFDASGSTRSSRCLTGRPGRILS